MSRLWQLPSVVVAVLVVGAPLLSFLGLAGPGMFYPFFAGVGLGAVCTVGLAGASAFASATGRPWRSAAVKATVVPMALTLGVLGYSIVGGGGTGHPIHDVTTDREDTLAFTPDVAALEQVPMTPREQVLELQRQVYPEIEPLRVSLPAEQVFEKALAVAQGMERWQLLNSDAASGRIEATATSRIFRFVDDVVIRVRDDAGETVVDVRSRSRMGQSDLGANSARIRAYLSNLQAALGA